MNNQNQRYSRHFSLKGFGFESQEKLRAAKVLVIGAGGLGCPALQYLAAAGIGTLGIADDDVIALSNLQRQILYTTSDVGKEKVTVSGKKLMEINPEITINSHKILVSSTNILNLITDYDVVVDCTDNFAARYLINDACFLTDKPLIFGAIFQYEGQVAVFNVADENGLKTNYRNLFPTPPDPLEVADCNEAGVLGVLPGIIGTIQATEVIKLLTGIGELLNNKLLTFSVLNYESFVLEIPLDDATAIHLPKDKTELEATDYNWLCGTSISGITELNASEFLIKIKEEKTVLIDVRETHELPKLPFSNINIPLSTFDENPMEIKKENIILLCQSGKRSLKAAQFLLEKFGKTKKISHLKGGIIALQEYKNE